MKSEAIFAQMEAGVDESVREPQKAKGAAAKDRVGPREDTDSEFDPAELEELEPADVSTVFRMDPAERRKYE